MKRLTIALFMLASCRPDAPQTEYLFTDVKNLKPQDLISLSPEGYYYKLPTVEEPVQVLSPWENKSAWYRRAIHDYGHGGRLRVGYDNSKTGATWIITTADSIRYYDSAMGSPSSALTPLEGALSDK